MKLYTYCFRLDLYLKEYDEFVCNIMKCKIPFTHEYNLYGFCTEYRFIDTFIYFPEFSYYLLTEREV